ncbi:MAG: type II secretion system F family protein [Frankiaceae bacterium]|nr:type II secretion system F family protein [Frankiaceae bacterium]
MRTLLACLLVAVASAPAAAADEVIRSASPRPGEVSLVLSVPPEARAGLRVTINGTPVPSSVHAAEAVPDRSVMLLLDQSGSMKGEPIRQAAAAARAFGSAVPADVRVGLTVFSDRVQVLLDPTLDRSRLTRALDGVRAGGNTTLYDAVLVALRRLGPSGARSIVLLSDGQDTRSVRSVEQAGAAVSAAHVELQVIQLVTPLGKPAPLQQLARAGGGTVLGVTSASRLPAAFRTAAGALRDQVVVTAAVPPGTEGQVTVGVDAGGVHDEAVVLLPTPAADAAALPAVPRPPDGRPSLLLAAALVFLGLFGLSSLLLSSPARDRRRRTELLSAYTARPAQQVEAPAAQPGVLLRLAEKWGRRGDRAGLQEKLERAGIERSPGDWLVRQIATGLAVTVLLTLLTNVVVGVGAGLLVSLVGFRWWLGHKAKRRLAKFQADLPDSLQLVASSLSAGYSLPQALDAVVQEGNEPLAGEFGRALAEARLGVPVEDALDVVATRVGSEDFRWVVLSIRIQRSTGGNLSEVLLTVCKTMRDRAAMRRQVKALSAEGRLSAYLLIGLPIGLALFEFSFRREYMRPLYTSGLGIAMLVMGCLGIVVGALWMRKIINVGD